MNQYSYLDQYKIIKTLGHGFSAKVKLAQSPDKKLVAIKRFKKQVTNLSNQKHELEIISKLHHQNLINLIDVRPQATYIKKNGTTFNCFAIILQYAGGGELFDFIVLGGRFHNAIARTYFLQLIQAVNYMHQKGFAHRDIKPQNILLTDNFVLKLADFGFSTMLEGKDHSGILHTRLGTQGYMAPQIQTKKYQGRKADIFSCGVILFVMYTACPPFQKSIPIDPKYNLIKQKKYNLFWQLHQKKRYYGFFSDDFKDLIQKMLEYDPNKRITIQQIRKHPWLDGQSYSQTQIQIQFKIRKRKVDAQLKLKRQQRQLQKLQRNSYLSNQSARSTTQINEQMEVFVQKTETYRKLPIKEQIQTGDYIIKQQQDYFFSKIIKLLNNPININCDQIQIQFNSQCLVNNNKIQVKMKYECQDYIFNITFMIDVAKTTQQYLCLSFRRINGNILYYKTIISFIKSQFPHHSNNLFEW